MISVTQFRIVRMMPPMIGMLRIEVDDEADRVEHDVHHLAARRGPPISPRSRPPR